MNTDGNVRPAIRCAAGATAIVSCALTVELNSKTHIMERRTFLTIR